MALSVIHSKLLLFKYKLFKYIYLNRINNNIGPHSIYCELISHHSEMGNWSQALNVFIALCMIGQEPDPMILKPLFLALNQRHRQDIIVEIIGELRKLKISISYDELGLAFSRQHHQEQNHPQHKNMQETSNKSNGYLLTKPQLHNTTASHISTSVLPSQVIK